MKNDTGLDYKECVDITSLAIEYIFELSAIHIIKFDLILIVIYWPNNSRETLIFNTQLEKLLNIIQKKYSNKNIIIGGDLNVDFINKTNQSKSMINLFKQHNFKQNINEPTRVTEKSTTCLDIAFTNFDTSSISFHVKEFGLSDHKGVQVNFTNTKVSNNESYFTTKRTFNDKNLRLFRMKLQTVNWENIIKPENDINQNYNAFHTQLSSILNDYIPRRRIKIKSKNKTWLTHGIKISCKNKRLLKNIISQTKNSVLIDYYKKYEKMLKKTVQVSKKNECIKIMKNSKNIAKSMWQIIKDKTNKHVNRSKNNLKLNINDTIIENPSEVANLLNDYFVSIGSDLDTKEEPKGRPVIMPILNTFYLSPVSPADVEKNIRNLKNKISCGHDELPPKLIKYCIKELVMPITYLINQSYKEAKFPDLLKIAVIKPIPKKKTSLDPSQFRPISLLSTFSKIFESAMAKQLEAFCEKYLVLDNCQNGFRKKKSTITALYKFVNDSLEIINNKKYAVSVMLDLSKAYDRVNHKILLNKLYGIGVRGQANEWFASYLNKRKQLVTVEHFNPHKNNLASFNSKVLNTINSIPQGSVLGGLLFLIYVNDLPKTISKTCVLYADDISIVIPTDKSEELQQEIGQSLRVIDKWLDEHGLKLNLAKTKIMQFHPYQKQPLKINIDYKQNKLETVQSSTLLGVELDRNFNWKPHVEKVSSKISKFIYALYKLKKCTDLKTATSAYYAYAHAWLSYGIILWGGSPDVTQLFILQKRCLRILVNISEMESCRPHFTSQKILTLTSIYILELCKFVRERKAVFPQVKDLITTTHNLRHKNRLALPNTQLQIVRNGAYYMSIKVYNKLPMNLKSIEKNSLFYKKLKEYLIQNCFYSIREFFERK